MHKSHTPTFTNCTSATPSDYGMPEKPTDVESRAGVGGAAVHNTHTPTFTDCTSATPSDYGMAEKPNAAAIQFPHIL